MNWMMLFVILLSSGHEAGKDCPADQIVHAKKIYAPTPYLRGLLSECGSVESPIIELTVDTCGNLENVRFLRESGCPAADQKLLECIRFWKYEPARCDSEPIDETFSLTIHWHPEEREIEDPCKPETVEGEDSPQEKPEVYVGVS